MMICTTVICLFITIESITRTNAHPFDGTSSVSTTPPQDLNSGFGSFGSGSGGFGFDPPMSLEEYLAASTTIAQPTTTTPVTTTTSGYGPLIDEEFEKLSICLSEQDYSDMMNNTVTPSVALAMSNLLIEESIHTIIRNELRAVFGFPPLGAWKIFRINYRTREELAAATTIEAYYETREPRFQFSSAGNSMLLEKNVIAAVEFLDKRIPEIRRICRMRFGMIREEHTGTIDRELVDMLIDEIVKLGDKLHSVILEKKRYECF